nr:MAG TPA_asm: hypothetical protein [Caudoviricetes sp.]
MNFAPNSLSKAISLGTYKIKNSFKKSIEYNRRHLW